MRVADMEGTLRMNAMNGDDRRRQRPSEDERTMRRLVEWGRALKKDRINGNADERNLMPECSIWRDGEHVAHLWLQGDQFYSANSLRVAIGGFGADEVHVMCDTYTAKASSIDEFLKVGYGDLAKAFFSSDPSKRALVSEALWIYRAKRRADVSGVDEWIRTVPYAYDPKRHRYKWEPACEQGDMFVRGVVVDALTKLDVSAFIARADRSLIEGADSRFQLDLATTKVLLSRDTPVALASVTDEQRARVNEAVEGMDVEVSRIEA
mgnify:CR=1 FL=1